MDHGGVDH